MRSPETRKDIPFRRPGERRGSPGLMLRVSLPVLTVFVCLFVALLPWGLPGFGVVTPVLPLIAIYFWVLDFPAHMPSWLVFLAGLGYDILSGSPPGLWSFGFLVLYGFAITQRRALAGKPFIVSWAGFLLAAGSAWLAVWLTAMAVRGTVMPILPALVALVMTVALYPLLVKLLGRIRRMTGLEYEA